MLTAAAVFTALAALVHVYIFVLESIRWRQPATWKIFGLRSQADADTTAPLAYNQGFYNLFLAIGALVGVVLLLTEAREAGYALALLSTGSMLAAAGVLLSTGRSRLRSAAVQGTFPLLAVALLLLSLAV
jgi:putative membrane protein